MGNKIPRKLQKYKLQRIKTYRKHQLKNNCFCTKINLIMIDSKPINKIIRRVASKCDISTKDFDPGQ